MRPFSSSGPPVAAAGLSLAGGRPAPTPGLPPGRCRPTPTPGARVLRTPAPGRSHPGAALLTTTLWRLAFLCPFLIGLPLAACSGDQAGSGTIDELPITSVERELRIGALDDPDFAFTPVTAILVAPDGTIWTLHRQEPVLRRWGADGRPLGRVGRRGEGPGEFTTPFAMGTMGDSLWVHDMGSQRFTRFTWDGTFLGTLPAPVDLGSRADAEVGQYPVRAGGLLADGTVHAMTPGFSQDIVEGRLTRISHVRQDADAQPLDTLVRVPVGKASTLGLTQETSGVFTAQPFGDAMMALPSPDGTELVLLDRTAAGAPGPATFRVTRVAMLPSGIGHAPGDTVRVTEVRYRAVPLRSAEVARELDRITDQLWSFMGERLGISRSQMRRQVEEAAYVPATRPAAGRMIAGADGSTWVELLDEPAEVAGDLGGEAGNAETPATPTRWLVLDAEGQAMRRVEVPPRVRPLAATVERFWGTETDELEVEYVVRYRIVD